MPAFQENAQGYEVDLAGRTNVISTLLIKPRLQLPGFDKSALHTLHHYTALSDYSIVHHLNEQKEDMEQKCSVTWRATLDRYADEIAAIQSELERTRADFDQRIDAHRARLQKFSDAISSDLQASASALDSLGTTLGEVTSQYSTLRKGYSFSDLHSLR